MPDPASTKKKSIKGAAGASTDQKQRREQALVKLRKEKREEGLLKKRNTNVAEEVPAQNAGASSSAAPAVTEVKLEHLQSYCVAARSADAQQQLIGVTSIRKLLSKESNPPVTPVLKCGILQRLIELLDSSDAKVQFEAAWAVTNIASTEFTGEVVAAGAIGPLVKCMMAADGNVREQSIWCCGNIAGDCTKYRDQLIQTPGAVEALLRNIQYPESIALLRNATWALSNLCRGKPTPNEAAVRFMLPALAWLLGNTDREVLQDATWGLSYLTDGDESIITAVLEAGVAKRLVELMGHEEMTVVTPALRTVGNMICGNDKHTQAAIDAGALKHLVPLLVNSKRNIRREACWAVSNVAAGTAVQINSLMMQSGLMANVITQLRAGEWNVRKEAAWVVNNVASTGAPEHVRTLVGLGVIEPLCAMLNSEDTRTLCVVLDAIKVMLDVAVKLDAAGPATGIADLFEEAGLLDNLEHLQSIAAEDVYQKCVTIIEAHFNSEGDEDDAPSAAQPTCAPGGTFGFNSNFSSGLNGGAANGFGVLATVAANQLPPGQTANFGFGFMTPPSAAATGQCMPAPAPSAPAFNFAAVSFV